MVVAHSLGLAGFLLKLIEQCRPAPSFCATPTWASMQRLRPRRGNSSEHASKSKKAAYSRLRGPPGQQARS